MSCIHALLPPLRLAPLVVRLHLGLHLSSCCLQAAVHEQRIQKHMSVTWAAAGQICHLPFLMSGACRHPGLDSRLLHCATVCQCPCCCALTKAHQSAWTSVFFCCRVLDTIKDNLRKEQSTAMEFNFLTMTKILSPIQVSISQANLCPVLRLVHHHVSFCKSYIGFNIQSLIGLCCQETASALSSCSV